VCVCLCYPDFVYDFFVCVHSHARFIKGTSKSSTDEMHSKLTWHEMWEVEVVSIMKEDLIEKSRIILSTGGYPR